MINDSIHQTNIHGVGVGLRPQHFKTILETPHDIAWFEALSDNYLHASGPAYYHLCKIAEQTPVTLHGVGLAVGSVDPVDADYCRRLKYLAEAIKAPIISDHLCWTKAHGHYAHELIPFPYTQATLAWLTDKIDRTQSLLKQPIMLENVSRYVTYLNNEMPESVFLNALCEQTGCGILLDVNNLYVNQFNHSDDPHAYFESLSSKHVWQMHLGGYTDKGEYLLDSHGEAIHPPVWKLYETALQYFPKTPTLIEWDHDVPPLETLLAQAKKAEAIFFDNQCALRQG